MNKKNTTINTIPISSPAKVALRVIWRNSFLLSSGVKSFLCTGSSLSLFMESMDEFLGELILGLVFIGIPSIFILAITLLSSSIFSCFFFLFLSFKIPTSHPLYRYIDDILQSVLLLILKLQASLSYKSPYIYYILYGIYNPLEDLLVMEYFLLK